MNVGLILVMILMMLLKIVDYSVMLFFMTWIEYVGVDSDEDHFYETEVDKYSLEETKKKACWASTHHFSEAVFLAFL